MEFLKKNYEKILLGLVLAGLAGVAVFLLILVQNEKQQLDEIRNRIISRKVEELPPLELTPVDALIRRANSTVAFDFSSTNKLFNSVTWGRTPDNRLVKIDLANMAQRLEATNVVPLYLIITLDNVTLSPDGTPRYVIGVEQQAAALPARRGRRATYASLDEKKDFFTIRAAEGPPENPSNLILELTETGERISLSKDRPFRRIEGYMADLKYDPERRFWPKRRKDDSIAFAGEEYKIVDIKEGEIVLSAKSNQKKWTIKF